MNKRPFEIDKQMGGEPACGLWEKHSTIKDNDPVRGDRRSKSFPVRKTKIRPTPGNDGSWKGSVPTPGRPLLNDKRVTVKTAKTH